MEEQNRDAAWEPTEEAPLRGIDPSQVVQGALVSWDRDSWPGFGSRAAEMPP